jgi:hypothetical protein
MAGTMHGNKTDGRSLRTHMQLPIARNLNILCENYVHTKNNSCCYGGEFVTAII